MTFPVRPNGEDATLFGALVASARRVFGCEAVVILARRTSDVIDAAGLGARELEELRRVPSSRGFLELGFEGVLSADVTYEGRRFGVLHALKRSGEAFDNPHLIGTSRALAFWRSSPRPYRGVERRFVVGTAVPRSGVPHRGHGAVRNAS